MSNLKLKLTYINFEMELEGEQSSVIELFNSIKKDGFGNILNCLSNQTVNNDEGIPNENNTQTSTSLKNYTNSCDIDHDHPNYPTLHDIVMKLSLNTEEEWVLIYCFYASDFGKKTFTKADIKNLYVTSNRYTESRNKNFSTNFKKLFKKNYLSALNTEDYLITDLGISTAKNIISGNSEIKSNVKEIIEDKNENISASSKVKKIENYKLVNLNLNENERVSLKEFYESIKPKAQKNQVLLLCHWLKENKEITYFNEDIVFTALRTVNEKVPKYISQVLRNFKNEDNYMIKNSDGTYSFTHIGEDFVKFKLLQGDNK